MNRWLPDSAHHLYQLPNPGDLVAAEHAVWRVAEVVDLPLSDADREVWLQAGMPDVATWKGRPVRVHVEWVAGARPLWAPADGSVPPGRVNVPASVHGHNETWRAYPPSGRWPMCSCCGEPMPCRAEMQDREVAAGMKRVEKLAQRLPGCCWACGEPITSRQRTVTYPGDNLDLPGGPPVRFHTRSKCWGAATSYEKRWIAQDPRRERILTYPECGGVLIVHADGTSECRAVHGPLGDWKQGEPDCRGHLTHDHRVHAACYVGDRWLERPQDMPGCLRGCPREGHPGTRTTRRPERRQLDQPELPADRIAEGGPS